jgi:chemotaxis protein histidine kinase CheA
MMPTRTLVIISVLIAALCCLSGCSLIDSMFGDPEAEKTRIKEQADSQIKAAQEQAKADAKAEVEKAAGAAKAEAEKAANEAKAEEAKIEAEKARVALENRVAQRDANRRIASLKNATEEQLTAIADELEQIGESKQQALEAWVRNQTLRLEQLNADADRRAQDILAAGKVRSDDIQKAARSRSDDIQKAAQAQIDKIDRDAAVLGGIAQVVPQLAGAASSVFPAGSVIFGGIAAAVGAALGHRRGKATGETNLAQIVSAASRVVDSMDILKEKDPAVAKAFKDHGKTLDEWQGLAGKQLVEDLQRGVKPRLEGVNA